MNWYKIAKKWKDKLPGGRSDKKKPSDFNEKSINDGIDIEFEHTNDRDIATEISIDHLQEFEDYYDKEVGLPAMEDRLKGKDKKLEDTKDARGLYNQMQGNEYNQSAPQEAILDWEASNRDELRKMRTLAQSGNFLAMKEYGEQLAQQGYDRLLVDKIMTAAMYKVKI